MTGIYGDTQEDKIRERELDAYLNSRKDWTDADKAKAKSELFDDITWNGAKWDENLEGWRMEMFIDWENVMTSRMPRDEKMAMLSDIQTRCVTNYCNDEVESNPDLYCERYCR